MCLTNETFINAPDAKGEGYKVFRVGPNGELLSLYYQDWKDRVKDQWLNSERVYGSLASGWYLFTSQEDASAYVTFLNLGSKIAANIHWAKPPYVVAKVEWRGLIAKGDYHDGVTDYYDLSVFEGQEVPSQIHFEEGFFIGRDGWVCQAKEPALRVEQIKIIEVLPEEANVPV